MSTYSPPRPQLGPTTPTTANQWGAGRVLALIVSCLLLLASFALAAGGGALAIAAGTQRDAGGYLMSDQVALQSSGYALTSANLEIQGAAALPHRILGDAKVSVTPHGGTPVFVGVAKTSAVRTYLAGVRRSEVSVFAEDSLYRQLNGGPPATTPANSDIWAASSTGPGTRTVTWPVQNGNWTIVVMNADGSSGVSADVATGATVPAVTWVSGGLFGGACVMLLLGVILVTVTVRRRSAA
jgi:hypothetical protein